MHPKSRAFTIDWRPGVVPGGSTQKVLLSFDSAAFCRSEGGGSGQWNDVALEEREAILAPAGHGEVPPMHWPLAISHAICRADLS